ncbi:MAG TPA: acetyl-CoA carboxylase biotin carboxyl carrier protein [Candidatus Baltobacteraceae bacterium]|nr:acetyl-CoA carboxylase biotin carboxyl carrier protein [Candidatus Baltobacteraceae bacterium]
MDPNDLRVLKSLIRLMRSNELEELEVADGERRVRLRRRTDAAPRSRRPLVPGSPSAPVPQTEPAADDTAGLLPITSPMVGTFYRAPAPGADPYVRDGDVVQKGRVVCIIEAMKLMNEIETDVAGRIARILVENGHAVEFGQTLFLVEPA